MENFLDSNMFEKMAREYNEKYGGVSTLKVEMFNSAKLKEVMENIHRLIHIFDTATSHHPSFVDFYAKRDGLLSLLKKLEEEQGVSCNKTFDESEENINNKTAINLLASIIQRLFSLHNDKNYEVLESLVVALLDAITAFYSVF